MDKKDLRLRSWLLGPGLAELDFFWYKNLVTFQLSNNVKVLPYLKVPFFPTTFLWFVGGRIIEEILIQRIIIQAIQKITATGFY